MPPNSMTDIKNLVEETVTAWEKFKQVSDQKLQAVSNGNTELTKSLNQKIERIEADVNKGMGDFKNVETEIELQKERIEMLETRASSPGKTATMKRRDEYSDTFMKWIRAKGANSYLEQKLEEQYSQMRINNDITIGTPSGGGYAVPEEISRMITVLEKKLSPVRDLVKVVQVGTSDYKELVDIAGESSGWVGELGTRSATTTPKLREVVPTHGELYAYPQVSEWSLDDIFFNVEEWLTTRVARDFAIKEGAAVIAGTGTNQPTGMLNTAPIATPDWTSPLRAAARYELISSDLTPGGIGVLADSLIDCVYKLNSIYRPNATWIMNSATVGAVRKLKDTTNQYLWQPGLALGQPDRLLGYPISVWEQMPDVGAGTYPVGFGSWKEAYVLVDRVGLRILRDPYSAIGHVRFYVRRREGGIVLNNDAAKFVGTL